MTRAWIALVLSLVSLTLSITSYVVSYNARQASLRATVRTLEGCRPSRLNWGHGRLGDGCHTMERENRK